MIILILFKLTSQSYKEWTKNKSDCQFLLSLNSGFFVYDLKWNNNALNYCSLFTSK